MNTPPLDYEPPPPRPQRPWLDVPFTLVLLGAWVAGWGAGYVACAPLWLDERDEAHELVRWALPSLGLGTALALLFHRRLRPFSVVALLVALALGLAPGAVAIARAFCSR